MSAPKVGPAPAPLSLKSSGQLLPLSSQRLAFAQLPTFQGPFGYSARKAGKPKQGPAEPRDLQHHGQSPEGNFPDAARTPMVTPATCFWGRFDNWLQHLDQLGPPSQLNLSCSEWPSFVLDKSRCPSRAAGRSPSSWDLWV